MFCPSCGLEDQQSNQFCRACGTDLRPARKTLEMPDQITASATTAREEIGRAFAQKIKEAQTAVDLKIVAEDVLPEIEKFLESPAEKRLRRMRVGTIIASIGAGAAIAFSIVATLVEADLAIVAGMGFVCFFIGLSFIINGLIFTVPKKTLPAQSTDAERQRELDSAMTADLSLPESNQVFTSVTEHTTRQLADQEKARRV